MQVKQTAIRESWAKLSANECASARLLRSRELIEWEVCDGCQQQLNECIHPFTVIRDVDANPSVYCAACIKREKNDPDV